MGNMFDFGQLGNWAIGQSSCVDSHYVMNLFSDFLVCDFECVCKDERSVQNLRILCSRNSCMHFRSVRILCWHLCCVICAFESPCVHACMHACMYVQVTREIPGLWVHFARLLTCVCVVVCVQMTGEVAELWVLSVRLGLKSLQAPCASVLRECMSPDLGT